MRIRVSHLTTYSYTTPAKSMIQMLRLTPRNHDGQYVVDWRIDVSADCRLAQQQDAFGNITHAFTVDGPLSELQVLVEGEVETRDTGGIIHGALERFPPSLFLRDTDLTEADQAIRDYAAEVHHAGNADTLSVLHRLLVRLHRDITFDTDPTHPATTAAQAFTLKRGVCQDLTHIFISASRSLGIPARYIGGHFHRADGVTSQEAGHAWAEAHVPELGWVAFDPTNGISGTDAHVRVAVGLDYLGASPVRGTRIGGTDETLDVSVHVTQSAIQSQN